MRTDKHRLMDQPLWTDRHQPALEDLPQERARNILTQIRGERVNLILQGPAGVGKTAAVRALIRGSHEDGESDLLTINVGDFFGMSKQELSEDPRFQSFITPKRRRELSKADLINHVLKELARHPPVGGDYKTLLLDNAEAIREDFQQALRRVMERFHGATQFVITTRQPSKLIAPIRSRCLAVPMPAPTTDQTVEVLRSIVTAEEVTATDDGLEFIAGYASGDLRRAILAAQTTAEHAEEITMEAAYEAIEDVGIDDRVESMVDTALAEDIPDARSILFELLIDEGYSGEEILQSVLKVTRKRPNGVDPATVHRLAGEIDLEMAEGTAPRIHLTRLLTELPATDAH